jgi:hypothetical protein
MSPDPIGPSTWAVIPGTGKSRRLTGKSGTSVWVRFALVHGQLQSDWSNPVLVTFPWPIDAPLPARRTGANDAPARRALFPLLMQRGGASVWA